MNPAVDDDQVMRRIALGEEAALRTLIARHEVRVFRFIQRLVGDRAEAEELTNEVFTEVWRNASRFQGRSTPQTWILSIAHHRAVSLLRKRREQPWDEERASDIADTDDDPETAVQKRDKSAIMRRCMEALSPEHREIVDLVYYHELSIAEAADVTGIPENTVKTRMFYARRRLWLLLQEA